MKKKDEYYSPDGSVVLNEDLKVIRNERVIKTKIFFDKMGAGFSSMQFINIFFSYVGASLLFIGVINVFKSVLNTITSSVVKRKCERGSFSKTLMTLSMVIVAFSLFLLVFAISIKSKIFFSFCVLVGGIFFVIHSEMFNFYLERQFRNLKPEIFKKKSTIIGILIIASSILISAILLEKISVNGAQILTPILGSLIYYGYMVSFQIAAFLFLVSSYFSIRSKSQNISSLNPSTTSSKSYFYELNKNIKIYCKNKYLIVLTFATLLVGVVQTIMNTFLGLYIYTQYYDSWFGGFINVGVMIIFALLVVLIGPAITNKLNQKMGVAPLFVFGTLLMAILPLTIVYNAYFPAVIVANMLSVLGASVIGSGHNLVAARLLNEKDRATYYSSSGIIIIVPFLILAIALSFIADSLGFIELFKYLGFGMIVCLAPIYFAIVLWVSKN